MSRILRSAFERLSSVWARSEDLAQQGTPIQGEDVGMMRAMGETRKGDWMETVTGLRFYPLDPSRDEVDLRDIAHHLSRINRYNGAMKFEDYSVATHSVIMADWMLQEYQDPFLAYQALFHDAPEAYIGDMVRPLKRNMPEFMDAEAGVWVAVVDRFPMLQFQGRIQAQEAGSALFYYDLDSRVKEADNRILVDERAQVMYKSGNTWGIDHLKPLGIMMPEWRPNLARTKFLECEEKLRSLCMVKLSKSV